MTARAKYAFSIGERVRPRAAWRRKPFADAVPKAGNVVARQPFGEDGAFQIEGADRRFFAGDVFEAAPARPRRRQR